MNLSWFNIQDWPHAHHMACFHLHLCTSASLTLPHFIHSCETTPLDLVLLNPFEPVTGWKNKNSPSCLNPTGTGRFVVCALMVMVVILPACLIFLAGEQLLRCCFSPDSHAGLGSEASLGNYYGKVVSRRHYIAFRAEREKQTVTSNWQLYCKHCLMHKFNLFWSFHRALHRV